MQTEPDSKEGVQIAPGVQAPQFLIGLLKMNVSLETLTFARYAPYPGLEQRLASLTGYPTRRKIPTTDKLRAATKDKPNYWDAVLTTSWSLEELELLIKEALRHDEKEEYERRSYMTVEEIKQGRLQQIINELPGDIVLALCSICNLRDGKVAHIPMMDFSCPISSFNLDRVKLCLMALGLRGAILESGKSYHFYGFDLMSHEEWLRFMAKCLLLSPYTDARYIAHRLLGGTCVLRITANSSKPVVPFVRELLW